MPYTTTACDSTCTATSWDYSNGYYDDTSTAGNCYGCWESTGAVTSDTVYFRPYIYVTNEYLEESIPPPPPETEEQRRVRLEREERRQAEYERERARMEEERKQREKEREAAKKKSMELLKNNVTLEEFNSLVEHGFIEIDSGINPGRKYRVPREARQMIDVFDKKGDKIEKLCIHPAIDCPDGDHILARVILLKFQEDYALEKANHWKP